MSQALEQQAATAEILNVISNSPTDTQPVFNAIVQSGLKLFPGALVSVALRYGDTINAAAVAAPDPARVEAWRRTISRTRLARNYMHGAALLDRRVVDIPDVAEAPGEFAAGGQNFLTSGNRAITIMPMMRGDEAIGLLSVVRLVAGALSDKQLAVLRTFANQAVIAIENTRLLKETKEALERQTATADILRVITSSPTDLGPVMAAVVANAARLADADHALIGQAEGDNLRWLSAYGCKAPEGLRRITRQLPSGRAMLDLQTTQIDDASRLAGDAALGHVGRELGVRSICATPLVRKGRAIGVLLVRRTQVRPFSERHVELLRTFADQAAIAIENVRLFNQTKEALERQTATAEILRVIASSPTDVQPVLDAIAERAAILCGAPNANVLLKDGDVLRTLAGFYRDVGGEAPDRTSTVPLRRGAVNGRAFLERKVVHHADALPLLDTEYPESRDLVRRFGIRSHLVVPLVREGDALGTISIWRREVRPFSSDEIALVQTFADQAVIAIENVRLFKELQERTEALTKSVDQLTALGEVGQAISSTLDLDTVLKTIVQRAVQLTGLDAGAIYEYDGPREQFHLRAAENIDEEVLAVYRSTPIRKGDGAVGRTAVAREPIQVPETQDESYKSEFRDLIIRTGRRALLAVPLMHEEQIVGALTVQRKTPGPFGPEVVDLLKTFATQSALAIQNANLFREIQEKSTQLEAANKHKSEFLANMSHELRTPLNAVIGFSEALIDQMFGGLNEKQLEYQKDIHESGKHLLSLINDILDLSKIEAGRMELEVSTFHLPAAVSNAVTFIRERAHRHGIALDVEVDERLGEFQADERKVKQILLNLLSNAVKFTPDGGRVDVRAKLDAGKVEIAVKDTGVGIAPEDQASLFEEFKQLGKDSARKAEGTGLGLALTKRLVELHGGRISVDSAVGQGSTFRVVLPIHY